MTFSNVSSVVQLEVEKKKLSKNHFFSKKIALSLLEAVSFPNCSRPLIKAKYFYPSAQENTSLCDQCKPNFTEQ